MRSIRSRTEPLASRWGVVVLLMGGCQIQTPPAHTDGADGTDAPPGYVRLPIEGTSVGRDGMSAGADLAFVQAGLLIGLPSVPKGSSDDYLASDSALLTRGGAESMFEEMRGAYIRDSWADWYEPDGNATDLNGFGAGVAATGDVTGDGLDDLAVADLPLPGRGTGEWSVFPGPDFGSGWWPGEPPTGPGTGPRPESSDPVRVRGWGTSARAARCGDVDGDGVGDLCTADGIVFGPIGNRAEPGLTWTAVEPHVAGADLDGDGRGELLVSDAATGAVYHLSALAPVGASTLPDLAGTTWTVAGGAVTALAVGDLDADGTPDVIAGWSDASGAGVSVGLPGGGGDLVSGARTRLLVPGGELAVGDFDGDGDDDLAVGGDAKVTVWLGPLAAGDLTDLDAVARYIGNEYPQDRFGHALTAADTDGDGRAELAIGAPSEDLAKGVPPFRDDEEGRVWWLPGAGL